MFLVYFLISFVVFSLMAGLISEPSSLLVNIGVGQNKFRLEIKQTVFLQQSVGGGTCVTDRDGTQAQVYIFRLESRRMEA